MKNIAEKSTFYNRSSISKRNANLYFQPIIKNHQLNRVKYAADDYNNTIIFTTNFVII
jgi:hypothetical protein